MRGSGSYQEPIGNGGTLWVSKDDWGISYYFPGPDRRYNGTSVQIDGKLVPLYIAAFAENWIEFERLKSEVPSGGSFTKGGKVGMRIQVGGYGEGLYLQSYHMLMSSKVQVESVIASYRRAMTRAEEIQACLRSI